MLFFLLAFLYFYVLGFNHIFESWNTSLFTSDINGKKGVLKRLINNRLGIKHFHGIVASILFSGSIVGAVYWMTSLRYPDTNYMFFLFLLIFLTGWVLRNDLGRKGIYASLILGHITFVLMFCRNDESAFFTKSLLLLGLPVGFFFLVKSIKILRQKGYVVVLLLAVFSASLVGDLNDHLLLTSYLYQSQKHPKDAFDIVTTVRKCITLTNMMKMRMAWATPATECYIFRVIRFQEGMWACHITISSGQ